MRRLRRWLRRRLYVWIVQEDDLAVTLGTLPDVLRRFGPQWRYLGDGPDKMAEVSFGWGTTARGGNWLVAWGGKWRYRIVPEE